MNFKLGRHALLVVLALAASACGGGGGGGGGTSISVSPKALTFRGTDAAPAAPQSVSVSFRGDGLLVGYPPEVPVPDWLYIEQAGGDASPVSFNLGVNSYVAPGTYSTTVRFVTGRTDGSQIKFADVSVTYVKSDFSVSPLSFAFDAVDGSTAQPTPADQRSFSISGTGLQWTAVSDRSWAVLQQSSGTGPATVGFTLQTGDLDPGVHVARFTVSNKGESAVITLTLDKRAPRLVVDPGSVSFGVNASTTAGGLALELQVSDELGGTDSARAAQWTLAAPVLAWLHADATSGTTASGTPLRLTLDADALKTMADGTYGTTLQFGYTAADGREGLLSVPVSLQLRLPRVTRVAPYVTFTDETAEVVLRGTGFSGVTDGQVRFGDMSSGTVSVISDTELRVMHGPLPEGRLDVWVDSVLNQPFTAATLLTLPPPALAGASIVSGNSKYKILFDPERSMLYAVDRADSEIERHEFVGGSWTPRQSLILPDLNDFSLSTDGAHLLVVTDDGLYRVDLGSEPLSAVKLLNNNDTFCSRYFGSVNVANNNEAVVHTYYGACSGYESFFAVNLDTLQVRSLGSIYHAKAALAANGSRIVMGGNGLSPAPQLSYFNASTGAVNFVPPSANVYAMTVNRDGKRVILQDELVYDQTFSLLGKLPSCSGSCGATAVSPNGTRAYRFRVASPSTRYVDVYDLTGALQAGGTYPLLTSLTVTDNPTGTDYASGTTSHVSLDGRTLFVAGATRILVIPLP